MNYKSKPRLVTAIMQTSFTVAEVELIDFEAMDGTICNENGRKDSSSNDEEVNALLPKNFFTDSSARLLSSGVSLNNRRSSISKE